MRAPERRALRETIQRPLRRQGYGFDDKTLVDDMLTAVAEDGRVTLTARQGGGTFSCQTSNGTCRINGVPGGSYSVQYQPDEGAAGPSSQAMIPPSGTVTLHVATGL